MSYCAACAADSRDVEGELSVLPYVSGRSHREFLHGGEKESRCHLKGGGGFYSMNKYVGSCRAAAAWCEGRVQRPPSITGQSLLLLIPELLCAADHSIVESPLHDHHIVL